MKKNFAVIFLSLAMLPVTVFGGDNLTVGTPGGCDQVVNRVGYALGYAEQYEQPAWVQITLQKKRTKTNALNAEKNFSQILRLRRALRH